MPLSTGGQRERLLSEVTQKIATVECLLGQLEGHKQQLVDNAKQVRDEIHSFVQDQVDGLHSRETQLLRQVDVLTNHQMSLLQSQLAHLHQTVGSLQSSWQSLQRCKSDMAAEKIYVEDVKCVKQVKALPVMQLSVNRATIQDAILGFGNVQVDGMLNMTECTTSKCLPSKVEDYMDGDHHLLYKPLDSVQGTSDTNVVKVCFPKLSSNKHLWLAKPNGTDENTKDTGHASLFKVKLPGTHKSSQIEHWLGQIKKEAACEPAGCEMEDFCFVNAASLSNSKKDVASSANSVPSESIEIISELSDMQEKFRDEEQVVCHCKESLSTIEIENLDSIPCFSDNDQWLAKQRSSASKTNEAISNKMTMPPIQIEKVCKANERCSSFDNCLCDVNCEQEAKEHWIDKQQQSNKYKLLPLEATDNKVQSQKMKTPLPLPYQEKDLSYWLAKNSASGQDSSFHNSKILYQPPTSAWIRSSSVSSPSPGRGSFTLPSIFSDSSSTWLRSRASKESKNAEKNMQKKDLLRHVLKSDSSIWLKSQNSPADCSDKMHKCRKFSVPPLFSYGLSMWLHPRKEQVEDKENSSTEPQVLGCNLDRSSFHGERNGLSRWLLQPEKNTEKGSEAQKSEIKELTHKAFCHDLKANHLKSSHWLKSGLFINEKNIDRSLREAEKHNLANDIANQLKWLTIGCNSPLVQIKAKN